jgi:DNA-binding transcriptional MerR regulator
MKINEVETLVGITKKNIRFYEQEGLLTPRRNRENGYRDYGDGEVLLLQQIKLLRKLGLSLEEIRQLQSGQLTVHDGMHRHQISLARQQTSLAQAQALCQMLSETEGRLSELDPVPWLSKMEAMEQEGTSFMNKQNLDIRRKLVAPVVVTVVMVAAMAALMALFGWCTTLEEDPMPRWLMILFDLPCVAVMVGVTLALISRIKELLGGEINAATYY